MSLLWLQSLLTGLRTQVCIMFKAAEGFRVQTNENKGYEEPVATARYSQCCNRYILLTWANELSPWTHCDPIFRDCPPGETVDCYTAVILYEGQEIDQAISHVQAKVETLKSRTHGD